MTWDRVPGVIASAEGARAADEASSAPTTMRTCTRVRRSRWDDADMQKPFGNAYERCPVGFGSEVPGRCAHTQRLHPKARPVAGPCRRAGSSAPALLR